MNSVIISGNICKNIELRATSNGKEVLSNTIAVDMGNDATGFIDFVCWGNTAKFVSQYANKGEKIVLCGSWSQRKYQNKEGKDVIVNEILVNSVELCSAKKVEVNIDKKGNVDASGLGFDSDLPF